jgi:hypothetical protein
MEGTNRLLALDSQAAINERRGQGGQYRTGTNESTAPRMCYIMIYYVNSLQTYIVTYYIPTNERNVDTTLVGRRRTAGSSA